MSDAYGIGCAELTKLEQLKELLMLRSYFEFLHTLPVCVQKQGV